MNQLPNMGGPPPQKSIDAKASLSIPSLLIIILGALGVVEAVSSLVLYASGGKTLAPLMGPLLDALKDLPAESRRQLEDALKEGFQGSVSNYAQVFLGIAAGAVSVYGGLQMRNAKSWGLSLAAAIIVMLPFLGCCCCLGLPIGIWAIVILVKPEVKAQFS